jgi:hypothetical protein
LHPAIFFTGNFLKRITVTNQKSNFYEKNNTLGHNVVYGSYACLQCEYLVINGNVIQQFEPAFGDGEDATIFPFIVEDINIEGSIDLILRMYGATGNQQIVLDNIVWTGYDAEEPIYDFSEDFSELFTFSLANGNTPDWLTGTNNRGLAVYGENLYAANLSGNVIRVLDTETGELKNSVTLTGVIGGLQTLGTCDLEVDAEGNILIGNLAADGGACPRAIHT